MGRYNSFDTVVIERYGCYTQASDWEIVDMFTKDSIEYFYEYEVKDLPDFDKYKEVGVVRVGMNS